MKTINFQEFEVLLQKMKESLESNIINLKNEMESLVLENEILDTVDMASLENDSINHKALLKQQEHELDEVNHALEKIKNGTYGVCEKNGDTIPIERLHAEPSTRYCMEDARKIEK